MGLTAVTPPPSDDDGGPDAVREHLGRVGQPPRVARRTAVGRPGDGAGVEHVVGAYPLPLSTEGRATPARPARPAGPAALRVRFPAVGRRPSSRTTPRVHLDDVDRRPGAQPRVDLEDLARRANAWAPTPWPLRPRFTASAARGRRRGGGAGQGGEHRAGPAGQRAAREHVGLADRAVRQPDRDVDADHLHVEVGAHGLDERLDRGCDHHPGPRRARHQQRPDPPAGQRRRRGRRRGARPRRVALSFSTRFARALDRAAVSHWGLLTPIQQIPAWLLVVSHAGQAGAHVDACRRARRHARTPEPAFPRRMVRRTSSASSISCASSPPAELAKNPGYDLRNVALHPGICIIVCIFPEHRDASCRHQSRRRSLGCGPVDSWSVSREGPRPEPRVARKFS